MGHADFGVRQSWNGILILPIINCITMNRLYRFLHTLTSIFLNNVCLAFCYASTVLTSHFDSRLGCLTTLLSSILTTRFMQSLSSKACRLTREKYLWLSKKKAYILLYYSYKWKELHLHGVCLGKLIIAMIIAPLLVH